MSTWIPDQKYLDIARQVRDTANPAGPLPLAFANDETDMGLAGAIANSEIIRDGWCPCKAPPGEQVYFRSPAGGHGWMHGDPRCRRITQTG